MYIYPTISFEAGKSTNQPTQLNDVQAPSSRGCRVPVKVTGIVFKLGTFCRCGFLPPQILMKKIQKVKFLSKFGCGIIFFLKMLKTTLVFDLDHQRFCSLLGFLIQEKSWIRVTFDSLVSYGGLRYARSDHGDVHLI